MTNPTAADCRRALAMIGHHTRSHDTGITAIIDEANQAERGTNLLMALLDAYQFIVPELRTKGAMAALSQWVDLCAKQTSHPDWARAAAITIAHATTNVDRFNTLIAEANETKRTSHLIAAILDIYAALLPELYTPVGTEAISQWTARFSGEENTE